MSVLKSGLVTSTMLVSGLALMAPALAQAQQAAPSSTVEEVVVTAQKTTQNIQNVPIAITAVTAKALQQKGINDVSKLTNIAPNVQLDAGTPFSGSDAVLSAYIRGIGQDDFAFNLDPGVGVYVDGVYLARSVGANTSMLDVDRVEILKGPQGTLFGRNTIGGAISIITRDPGHDFMVRGEVTTGQFSRLDTRITADLPITDKILTSITFDEERRNGWQHRIPFPGAVAGSSGIPDCDALAAGTKCAVSMRPTPTSRRPAMRPPSARAARTSGAPAARCCCCLPTTSGSPWKATTPSSTSRPRRTPPWRSIRASASAASTTPAWWARRWACCAPSRA
jgi:outer membrane receptor protein involved in Fe transport